MQKDKASITIYEYLDQFPEQQKATLEKVRRAILSAAPGIEESISYGIPMYKKGGQLAAIGGFKNHCSFFPTSYAVMKSVKDELSNYKVSKGTIQFPIDKPLPSSLVKKMVKAKLKENEEKQRKSIPKS